MRITTRTIICAIAVTPWIIGCSSDDDDPEAKRKKVDREPTAASEFKPTELEATIDSLVEAIGETEEEDIQIDIVLKSLLGYFQPITVGANRALGELNVAGTVAAPASTVKEEQTQEQIEMMKSARSSANGIGLAPMGTDLVKQIDAAANVDLPVVLIDSDQESSKRDLYIGTLNAEAGTTGGETLLSLLSEPAGTIVILGNDDPTWSGGYDRTMGARDVLADEGYDVSIVTADWAQETGELENIAAMVDIIAEADPPVVGMLGMFSNAYQCAMAAEESGMDAGDIAIAAFDFDTKTVEYMQSGYISVTHAQRNYYMGYLAPYALYGMITLGVQETKEILSDQMVDNKRLDSGLDIVPAKKLDEYYDFLDGLGVGE